MELQQALLSIHPLSENSLHELMHSWDLSTYPKGHVLSKQDTIEKYIYIVTRGIIRAYRIINGEEITFWIGEEGSIACSMRNYVENKPSYENIETLENCTLFRIKISDLTCLYDKNIEIANWGRKFIEYEIIKTENKLIHQLYLSAKERYNLLLKERPQLLQRLPLSIIASYLGITQVSLSRIRSMK
ncbi:Crp/Fnr family transcriptional regulator [Apibacter sp. HY039]|uniref:Crp/Fnr family transcriptional regulator n=1 Tax=Apibacter sp. HY039 TaxID=2501476 RepID=UPI000FEBE9CF|nr:Crp/Fnr family transcriptional regulator [Apibacter sp. HY039]